MKVRLLIGSIASISKAWIINDRPEDWQAIDTTPSVFDMSLLQEGVDDMQYLLIAELN